MPGMAGEESPVFGADAVAAMKIPRHPLICQGDIARIGERRKKWLAKTKWAGCDPIGLGQTHEVR